MQNMELERLKALLQKNHEAATAAIDQLMLKHNENRLARGHQPASVAVVNPPRRRTTEIVEELITSYTRDFTIYDILMQLQASTGKPPNSDRGRIVSGVINKLRQRNPPEIEEVEKGRGRRSGTYRYKNPRA
jgi:hypothetical protein